MEINSEQEIMEIMGKMERAKEEGLKNTFKYFDRIHDKLFVFNNILIAGFFGLSKFDSQISMKLILIPILNLSFLIYIEFEMMEINRFIAKVDTKRIEEIETNGERINRTNLFSLMSIFSTLVVALTFLYFLL
jgi:hypothetical protein